jgi:uncharacterized DUF497 family protein
MKLEWGEEKRRRTVQERGLDFADCTTVFAGPTFSFVDDRKDYGEDRHITVGVLQGQLVVVVHTERRDTTRIISMRWANASEKTEYSKYLGIR